MDLILSFAVSFITQLLKRLGIRDDGDHLAIFVLALLISFWNFGLKLMPEAYVSSVLEIWAGALLWYEVLLKKIKVFRKLGGRE